MAARPAAGSAWKAVRDSTLAAQAVTAAVRGYAHSSPSGSVAASASSTKTTCWLAALRAVEVLNNANAWAAATTASSAPAMAGVYGAAAARRSAAAHRPRPSASWST